MEASKTPNSFMRRMTLIFSILLTFTAGVWSSALAGAWCLHEMSAPAATASDEHDCCRARVGEPNRHHSESPENSHEATREKTIPQTQAAGQHSRMDCEGVGEPARKSKVKAFGERRSSCFECCAGRTGQTPTATVVVAPEQSKVKRDAANAFVAARDLFAPALLNVSHLVPSQHAPPATGQRRQILISVFLI